MFAPRTRLAVTALAACAVLGLTACGDDDDGGSTVTSVAIRPNSYEVKPPATTPTTAPPAPVANEEGKSDVEQAFTITEEYQYPFEIAQLFEIDLEELRNWNGWDADYGNYPGVGGIARIPPGAKFVDPTATSTTEADTGEGEATQTASGECTYTLEENDYPVEVAEKFDLELTALLAANGWAIDAAGNVAAWPAAGTTINLPDGPNCTSTATATTVAG